MLTMLLFATLAAGATMPVELAPGESVGVFDHGTGRTVVLVPGLTGCIYGFRHVVPQLTEAGCRVIVIEPLGVGSSARPENADYSLTAQADRIAAVMDRLDSGAALVVGHGLAGSMVLRLAYRRPDLVAGIVSIEGGPDENALTSSVKGTLGFASALARIGATRLLRDRFRASLEASSGDPSWLDGVTLRKYFAGMARDIPGTIAALRVMADTREPEALHANLGRIACPVTMLLGAAPHKGRPEPEALALLQSRVEDFRTIEFADAGHFLFEEVPDLVAAAVLGALETEQAALLASRQERREP